MQIQGDELRVKVAGSAFTLRRAAVEERVRAVLPEPVKDHFVAVAGRRYPPKQVVALVTGLDRADFTTHQARRILRRLGFSVGRKTDGVVQRPGAAAPELRGRDEAEAITPYVGKWIARKGADVLVAADTPEEVLEWLERHDVYADVMFRVPKRLEDWDVPGIGPL